MRVSLRAIALTGCFLAVSARGADSEPVVATVGSRKITRSELEKRARGRLVQLEQQRYQALKATLEELVAAELFEQEAKARSLDVAVFLEQEVTAKIAEPGDEEIRNVYLENKEQMGDVTLEAMKPQIVAYLKEARRVERRAALVAELKARRKTTISLAPPLVPVSASGRPSKGGGVSAPVTIVEFTDFQCGFCRQAESVIDQVLKAYGDKVRLVVRDYPLAMHPDARLAAEAAACANAQGKYWSYHDRLFANANALGAAQLEAHARDLGLDAASFGKCLRERAHSAAIEADIADATEAGVTGTPVFFVNGRMLVGVQPFSAFRETIDELLASQRPR